MKGGVFNDIPERNKNSAVTVRAYVLESRLNFQGGDAEHSKHARLRYIASPIFRLSFDLREIFKRRV